MTVDYGMTGFRPGINIENMKIWVDGLLSDEFEQGRGRLASCEVNYLGERGPKQLCCLGVATELAIRHGLDVKVNEHPGPNKVIFDYDGHRDFLPSKVREWLGLERANPDLKVTFNDGTTSSALASALNDGEAGDLYDAAYTYRDIALAIIRTYNLPGYEHLLEEADAQTTA